MNNITKNILASNQWLKENRPTAKIITLDQVIKRLKKGHFLGTENSKTKKGNKDGFYTGILYLAPHKITGFNFCAMAINCIKDCLFNSGRGKFATVTIARIIKTLAFLLDRTEFIKHIEKDILRLKNKAIKNNYALAIRLNGTSDINISKYFGHIIDDHKDVYFYDYTKILHFALNNKHDNYHITFSYDGLNIANTKKALEHGINASVVFKDKLPATFLGYNVIDGDENDLRFLDKKGIIIGLKYKGSTKNIHDDTFVVDLEKTNLPYN